MAIRMLEPLSYEEGTRSFVGVVELDGACVDLDVVAITTSGVPKLPDDLNAALARVPEAFKKARAMLRGWFTRPNNPWVDVDFALETLCLDARGGAEFVFEVAGGHGGYWAGAFVVMAEPSGVVWFEDA